jgi:hypothetical protein
MFHKYSAALAVFFLCCAFNSIAQVKPAGNKFILLNGQSLALYKAQYKAGDTNVIKQVKALLRQADTILKGNTYSVTFNKTKVAPSGDKHDYVSMAPYWWPDSSKTDGKPYIRKDGRTNPEKFLLHDRDQIGRMADEVRKLATAYYFSGEESYARKAIILMKVWFLDPATRMNPNLNYAQYIPGINDGRGIGIIETVCLTNIPDALALLQQSKSFNKGFNIGIKQWFKQYLLWLQNSKNGKDELSQLNNHGTNYDLQVADIALFLGDSALVKKTITDQTIPRIAQQFTAEGTQPLELARTKSWGYTTMNLLAWCRLAVIADKVNIDLWHYQTKDGQGIEKCIKWLFPFVLKEKPWAYEQIEKFGYNDFYSIIALSNNHYQFSQTEKIYSLNKHPELIY